ncbi:MAG: hypothetical protein U9532_02945 ['Conium maculatum' witches'-broom phytoplasma]|nr:hypothetical protein ['Conium maculatum' witches'-broom phytoplasma]
MNEASILTVRNDKTLITQTELEEAIDRVLMGPAKNLENTTKKKEKWLLTMKRDKL